MKKDVRHFLSQHGFDESIVMEAKGLGGKPLRTKMDRLGYELAANVFLAREPATDLERDTATA